MKTWLATLFLFTLLVCALGVSALVSSPADSREFNAAGLPIAHVVLDEPYALGASSIDPARNEKVPSIDDLRHLYGELISNYPQILDSENIELRYGIYRRHGIKGERDAINGRAVYVFTGETPNDCSPNLFAPDPPGQFCNWAVVFDARSLEGLLLQVNPFN